MKMRPSSQTERGPARRQKRMALSVRPEIRVITHHHRPGCRFVETRREEDCKCKKYFYITAGKGEQYRLSAKTASWELARIRAHQWEERLDPNPSARPAESQHQMGTVIRRVEQLERQYQSIRTILLGRSEGQDASVKSHLSKSAPETSNQRLTSTRSWTTGRLTEASIPARVLSFSSFSPSERAPHRVPAC
jgi:hypothetical protein